MSGSAMEAATAPTFTAFTKASIHSSTTTNTATQVTNEDSEKVTTIVLTVLAVVIIAAIVVGLILRKRLKRRTLLRQQSQKKPVNIIEFPDIVEGKRPTGSNNNAEYSMEVESNVLSVRDTVSYFPRRDSGIDTSQSALSLNNGAAKGKPTTHPRSQSYTHIEKSALSLSSQDEGYYSSGRELTRMMSEDSGIYSTTSLNTNKDTPLLRLAAYNRTAKFPLERPRTMEPNILSQSQLTLQCSLSSMTQDGAECLKPYKELLDYSQESERGQVERFILSHPKPRCTVKSGLVAIGCFDQRGGILRLDGEDTVQLAIPEGALETPQLIYLFVKTEPANDDSITSFSPIVECGPEGTNFQVPVQLTFPHVAENVEVMAVSRQEPSDEWKENEDEVNISNITKDHVTINVRHFTGFMLTKAPSQSTHRQMSQSSSQAQRRQYPMHLPSRIPTRHYVHGQSPPSKRLLIKIFQLRHQMKIYVVMDRPRELCRQIEDKMKRLSFTASDTDWVPFRFVWGEGHLMFRRNDTMEPLFEPFTEVKLGGLQSECLTYDTNADEIIVLYIYQSLQEDYKSRPQGDYKQFSIRLPNPALTTQEYHTGMLSIQAASEVTPPPFYRSRGPSEHECEPDQGCSCQGACGCTTATERRQMFNRAYKSTASNRSKESGYNSSPELNSPPHTLRGPGERIPGDVDIPSDSSDLSINFVFHPNHCED